MKALLLACLLLGCLLGAEEMNPLFFRPFFEKVLEQAEVAMPKAPESKKATTSETEAPAIPVLPQAARGRRWTPCIAFASTALAMAAALARKSLRGLARTLKNLRLRRALATGSRDDIRNALQALSHTAPGTTLLRLAERFPDAQEWERQYWMKEKNDKDDKNGDAILEERFKPGNPMA